MGTTRPLAVVTGASSGIGLALARQAIAHGYDVVVCGDHDRIYSVAGNLPGGTRVHPVLADLAAYDGVEKLYQAILGLAQPVDALLLNAGVGVGGAFVRTSLDAELRMIALNVSSVVHLAKRVVPAMVARGRGRVLVTASVASTTPAPYLAVYAATKAFDLSFAEALRVELEGTGVTVTALQPGATDTHFFARAAMSDTWVGQSEKDDPDEVARQGFEAMLDGRATIVAASLRSKALGAANEILPETAKARLQAGLNKPRP